jgi:hypothetical protein
MSNRAPESENLDGAVAVAPGNANSTARVGQADQPKKTLVVKDQS